MPIREATGRDALRSQKGGVLQRPPKCQAPHGGDAETARGQKHTNASGRSKQQKIATGTARCVTQNDKIAIVPSIKKRHDCNTAVDSKNRLGINASQLHPARCQGITIFTCERSISVAETPNAQELLPPCPSLGPPPPLTIHHSMERSTLKNLRINQRDPPQRGQRLHAEESTDHPA